MLLVDALFFDGRTSKPSLVKLSLDQQVLTLTPSENGIQQIKIELQKKQVYFFSDYCQVEFQQGEHLQTLQIKDPRFIEELQASLKNSGQISWQQQFLNLGMRAFIPLTLFIFSLFVMMYLWVIPWMAEKVVVLIPITYDQKLGSSFYEEFIEHQEVDVARTEKLNLFAKELQFDNASRIRFTIVNSQVLNAFALPDGNIVVFSGLIDEMKGYDELAALIGHEVAHVNQRHSMKMLCKNLSGYIFVSVVLSDINGVMAVLGENAHQLQSLSYSRSFEQEADFESVKLLLENHINPNGMIALLSRLESKHDDMIPGFLSSHPITKDRKMNIRTQIDQSGYKHIPNKTLDEVFKKIQGL